jgi:hypothetical protein
MALFVVGINKILFVKNHFKNNLKGMDHVFSSSYPILIDKFTPIACILG